jgi:transcriptional regulator with XRE-family HTH domain
MNEISSLSLSHQIRLLVDSLTDETGHPYSSARIAAATGISDQTLLNLISGKSDNPRLDTLQKLCAFYGISLEYFECTSEQRCIEYLAHRRLEASSPIAHEIAVAADALSSQGKENVLTLLEWIESASAQHERKRH